MERETGIEPALVAWKATVLPLNYSRPGVFRFPELWWREVDSNHRRHEPADLQSAPVGRLGIPPRIPVVTSPVADHFARICRKRESRQAFLPAVSCVNHASAPSRV